MDLSAYRRQLRRNAKTFKTLLSGAPEAEYRWKPAPEKWSLLEIAGHLLDEEREDFRARTKHILETPGEPMPPINPAGWVTERNYAGQDFAQVLDAFLEARRESLQWLETLPPLTAPVWENVYQHPKLGAMSARMMLANWLAHDYLHIRQITRLRYDRLKALSGETLDYAGGW